MAMVAGTIANNGVVMEPYVVDRIVAPDGRIVVRGKASEMGRAVKPETAQQVASMMVDVVERGTGAAAKIPGVTVGGKTGTAETGVAGTNTTWFIAFAGRGKAQVAIAVVVEQQNSTGGVVAAPVAKDVLEALLGESGQSANS